MLPSAKRLDTRAHGCARVGESNIEERMVAMADGVYREERWDTSKADLDVHFYELTGETVWGATARILTGFLAHIVTAR